MAFPYENLERFIERVEPYLKVDNAVLHEAKKCRAIVEWAFEQQPFQVGDFVYYLKADRIEPSSGWHIYRGLLGRAPLEVVKVEFNTYVGEWYAQCRLSRYEFWSHFSQARLDEVKTSLFSFPLKHLIGSAEPDAMEKWLAKSKREQREAEKQHAEQEMEKLRKKKCKCGCGCGK